MIAYDLYKWLSMTASRASAIITAGWRWPRHTAPVSCREEKAMLTITCYGAVDEIGGNKILLEDSGSAMMFRAEYPSRP